MSEFLLPIGTKVVASLFRPVKESPGIGMAIAVAKDHPAGLLAVSAAFLLQADRMLEALPELMLPGAPVTCLMHVHLPDGRVTANSCSLMIDRAISRAAAGESIFGASFMNFVSAGFENARFASMQIASTVTPGSHLVQ